MKVFDGIRVVELAQYVMVPAAGAILADLGAEVIKVESPGLGDPYRSLVVDERTRNAPNFSLEQNNRGKRSFAVDLKNPRGHALFLKLIASADIFITSVRPAALERLKIAPADLRRHNPRLIYARANGLGFNGSDSGRPGFDASAFWARGGFAHLLATATGKFVRQPRALGDHAASVSLAFGIGSALFHRERTGEAILIETSLLAMATWMLSNDIVASQDANYPTDVLEQAVLQNPLVGAYQTSDGRWIQLVLLEADRYWPPFCRTIGHPELIDEPRWATAAARSANGAALIQHLAEIFAAQDWAYWQPVLNRLDAPWELVQSIDDVSRDEQVLENGLLFRVTTAEGVPVTLVSSPVALNGTQGHSDGSAPACGADTYDILNGLGVSAEEASELSTLGVVS